MAPAIMAIASLLAARQRQKQEQDQTYLNALDRAGGHYNGPIIPQGGGGGTGIGLALSMLGSLGGNGDVSPDEYDPRYGLLSSRNYGKP